MAELGTYYITVMPEMGKFTSAVNSALGNAGQQGGKTYSSSFLDVVKGSAIGSAIGNVVSSGLSYVKSGIEDGIKRLDTLNNYPKVMESLGYSAKDSADSINLIRQHLDGLPTSTDSMVRLTQSISDSTGDLDLATKAALGFNDMMLATGSSTEDMTNASTMLNRILGKQSATIEQWGSLQQYIPTQLSAIAEHMLGVGATSNDLYNALDEGTVSWNDFLQAIVDLDEQGEGHMASFYDQAKAMTGGIGTTIENIPNRISAGWEKILDAIGSENISSTIDDISYGIRDSMERIGDAIKYVKDKVGDTSIVKNLKDFGKTVGDAFKGIWDSEGGTEKLKAFVDAMVGLIDNVLQWLVDHKDLVTAAVGGITGAIAMLVGFKIGSTLAALPGLITAINTALMANPLVLIATLIGAVVMALYTFFTQTETGKKMWEDFTNFLKEAWESIKQGWDDMCANLKQQWEDFKALIDGIPDWWNGVIEYWKTAISDFCTYITELWEKVKTDAKEVWDNISNALNEWVTNLSESISTWCDNASETVATAWENIKTAVGEKVEAIRTAIAEKWEAIRTGIAEKAEAIHTALSEKWEAAKTMVTDKVLTMASKIYKTFGTIVTNVGEKVDAVKERLKNGFTVMKDAALDVFTKLKDGIKEKIEAAKTAIDNAITAIKKLLGLEGFEWSIPLPKLPHLKVEWNDVGYGLTLPALSLEWYAKGGIFDAATLIGVGERGPEAVLPLNDRTYGEIARGIAEQGGTGGVVIKDCTFNVREDADIDRIADALSARWLRDMGATA